MGNVSNRILKMCIDITSFTNFLIMGWLTQNSTCQIRKTYIYHVGFKLNKNSWKVHWKWVSRLLMFWFLCCRCISFSIQFSLFHLVFTLISSVLHAFFVEQQIFRLSGCWVGKMYVLGELFWPHLLQPQITLNLEWGIFRPCRNHK